MNLAIAILAVSFLPFFEARNQVANFVFDPPPEGKTVKPVLPNLIVTETCPGCNGKGELVLEEPDYGQAKGRIGPAKKTRKQCPLCNGKCKIQAFMNPSELALQVSADRAAFAAEHQGRGEIAVGEAFVPNAKHAELDKDRLKLVENAFGHPCKKCNWTGIEACKKCKGSGLVKCGNSDCKGGWAVVKTTTESSVTKSGCGVATTNIRTDCRGRNPRITGSSGGRTRRTTRKETSINVSPCSDCGRARQIVCPECGGRRAHPCSKCKGLGIKTKGSL